MTAQEQVVFDFYRWEHRYRGYELFSFPVGIQVPYLPFERRVHRSSKKIDDGKVVPFWKQLFQSNDAIDPKPKAVEFPTPERFEYHEDFHIIQVQISSKHDIRLDLAKELLESLTLTQKEVGYEIIVTGDEIRIQITCSLVDAIWVESHLAMYFPELNYVQRDQFDLPFDPEGSEIAVVDFGMQQESMLPVAIIQEFNHDPLASLFALLESIPDGACCAFQISFKGCDDPLQNDLLNAVYTGSREPFFADFPEMSQETERKVATPLVSARIRLVVQGHNDTHTEFLSVQIINSLHNTSRSKYNQLIPLSNEGYEYNNHMRNVLYRASNRPGMLLSVDELLTFAHFPTRDIHSPKLFGEEVKTKAVPKAFQNQKYILGINLHEGEKTEVRYDDESRLRHTHILGVTGVGKSTLLANMVLDDINQGNGCALFDPHGDIVEEVLARIPTIRKDDAILIDPSDVDFPIGFNLLHASTEAEKLVLSSDLVSAFREHSTAWGDTMTSVLSNAIDTFLNSSSGGTLIEMKRFLIDDTFRNNFLRNVEDSSLIFYWNNEYGLVKKRISPLLTRIDTFLRPKIIRLMMAQKRGVDFKEAIHNKKIILFKLSIGLIGEENAFLLGSLFLSKINQVALGRQSLNKEERHPYYLYLDECHHFMTPSIGMMLSGVRKYGVGLILAHQNIAQIEHIPTQNSILSNPYNRIYFRLGETDAKKIESSLSFFEAPDLTKLGRGETIVRFGSSDNDCNMSTFNLPEIKENNGIREHIINITRSNYTQPRNEVEEIIDSLLNVTRTKKEEKTPKKPEKREEVSLKTPPESVTIADPIPEVKTSTEEAIPHEVSEENKQKILDRATREENLRLHRKIQIQIKKTGQEFGFISSVEHEIHAGKRIDVSLKRGSLKIACEISVTNSVNYEVTNIQKCFEAGYLMVLMISDDDKHRKDIQKQAKSILDPRDYKRTRFISSDQTEALLKATIPKSKPTTETIKGFRVKTEFDLQSGNNDEQLRKDIERILRKKH